MIRLLSRRPAPPARARLSRLAGLALLCAAPGAWAAPAAPASAAPSAATAAPTEAEGRARAEALVQAFLAVARPAQEGGALTPAQEKANEAAFATLDGLFHRERLLAGALGPHAKALDAAQRAAFDRDFWWVLRRIAYPDSGAFFARAKRSVTAVTPSATGVDVTLHAVLAEEDLETDITLHWQRIDGALRLVDASFDGASLTLDYQNQFGRILAKKGPAGLLEALASQRAKLSR